LRTDAYYSGEYFTGKVCQTWWEYEHLMESYDVISQQQYEEETGSSGYYEGDDHEPIFLQLETIPNLLTAFTHLGPSEAVDIVASHFLCLGGVYRLVITVNGVPDEVEFFGACPQQNQDLVGGEVEPDASNQRLVRVEANTVDIKDTQEEQTTLLEDIGELLDEVKESLRQVAVAMGVTAGGEGDPDPGCVGEDCGIDPGQFETEASPEAMYERQYGEGLEGVGEALQGASELSGTSALSEFFTELQPVWPTSVPACLSWDIEVIFLGEIHFEPPCWLWDMLKTFLLLSAVVFAWSLMFGSNRNPA